MTQYRIVNHKKPTGEIVFKLQVWKLLDLGRPINMGSFSAQDYMKWEGDLFVDYETLEAAKAGIPAFKIRLEADEYNKKDNVVCEVTHD